MSTSIRVHILHCGRVRTDRALPFKEKTLHPAPYTGWLRKPECRIWMPVAAYLIEHPRGLVLIDTGWHTDMRTDQVGHMGRFHHSITAGDLPEGQAIHEQLAGMGIKTADLDYVLLSHLHSDHVSGVKHVGDAKNILVSEPEWRSAHRLERYLYVPSMWRGVSMGTYGFSPSGYGPQKSAFDLFGDGSIVSVHTPGHTRGTASTLVQSGGVFVLLYSDVGYARKSWEQMIPPGLAVNARQAQAALEWVGAMSRRPECVASLANHESGVSPQVIEL